MSSNKIPKTMNTALFSNARILAMAAAVVSSLSIAVAPAVAQTVDQGQADIRTGQAEVECLRLRSCESATRVNNAGVPEPLVIMGSLVAVGLGGFIRKEYMSQK